jgi:hypothetical protein
VIQCCAAGWKTAGPGGSGCGDLPLATGERTAAHGARYFKKVDRDLCWSTDVRFRFIEDRRAEYPVTIMCGVLDVSRAGYYAWRGRPESRRSTENLALLDDIKRVHHDNHECSGSPRIHRELKGRGPRDKPWSRRAADAPLRCSRHHGAATLGQDHRQSARPADRAQSARPQLYCGGP